jgi:hypothetical protein
MRFLCANGHPMKEGQKYCAVCGAGVFAGQQGPAAAKPKKRKRILIGAGAFVLVIGVIGAMAGPKAPKADAPAAPTTQSVVSDTPTPTDTYSPPPVQRSTSTPTPTHHASPKPTVLVHHSTPTPTPTVKKATKPKPTGVNGNPWGYNFNCCSEIYSPPSDFCSYFNCIASFWNGRGYVMECADGTYGKSGGISGSCSHHGGNDRALLAP